MRPVTRFPLDRVDAVLLDLDGVVTDTASTHAAAWKLAFDDFLEHRARLIGKPFVPFDRDADYRRHVDGRPRYDGAAAFLASRGIALPHGAPDDPPDRRSVCGIANHKDAVLRDLLGAAAVRAFPGTVAFVRALRARGRPAGVFSASRHCDEMLRAAGVRELFDVVVGGAEADRLGLPGKPDPAVLLEAARRLAVPPARVAVIEDAIAGVSAGRRGGFGLVVGVDRGGDDKRLADAGADLVVADLSALRIVGEP